MSDTQIDTPAPATEVADAPVVEQSAIATAEVASTDATTSVAVTPAEPVAEPVAPVSEVASTDATTSVAVAPAEQAPTNATAQAAEPVAAAGVALDVQSSELALVATSTATNELTEQQKKAVASLLEKTTELAKSLVQDGALGPLGVTRLIGSLMKNAEGLQVDGSTLKGSDKKKVVLEVGKQIINTYVTGEHKATVVSLYDGLAEPTLEAMIDMSRGVNFTTAAMHIINDKEAQVAVVNAIRVCGGFKCC